MNDPRCADCGDPATEEATETTVGICGVTEGPKFPVCSPCALRRRGGKKR